MAGGKAPIQELLHCPLAFAGVHLLKELPEHSRVAYHFCKEVNGDLNQCVLYDGTGPDAKLIGVEYLVSDAVYQKMPAEEKAYWHDHKYEVDAGYLKSLTQTGDEEKRTLAKVRTLWGKVYHTWASGTDYPRGPARLFWSVTGEQPFGFLSPDAKLPAELERVHRAKCGVLHLLVGVVDLGPAAPPHRPPQGRQGEPLVEAAAQLPAPDAAGEHVQGSWEGQH